MAIVKKRADQWLVELGLVETRSKAQAFILAGEVEYEEKGEWKKIDKAGSAFREGSQFRLLNDAKDVSRGATKLRGAFETWPELAAIAKDATALDIGSSTGGFTQVLLEKGAAKVVALDVGTHQLHEKLRADARVISCEQTHVLKVDAEYFKKLGAYPFDILTTDVSFISLTKILSHASLWLRRGGYWILLVKPQFELDAKKLHKGIVREEKYRVEALSRVESLATELGCFMVKGSRPSPIQGADGNVEYLLCLERSK